MIKQWPFFWSFIDNLRRLALNPEARNRAPEVAHDCVRCIVATFPHTFNTHIANRALNKKEKKLCLDVLKFLTI